VCLKSELVIVALVVWLVLSIYDFGAGVLAAYGVCAWNSLVLTRRTQERSKLGEGNIDQVAASVRAACAYLQSVSYKGVLQ
jgi:hypothetical protein